MAFTLTKVPDAPILIYTQLPVVNREQTIAESFDAISTMLGEQTEKVFLIYDVGDMSIELDDLIQAASKGARGSDAVLHHPNLRENVYVVSNMLVKMAIKGLESATFGRVKLAIFQTLDEALAYCRGQAATLGF